MQITRQRRFNVDWLRGVRRIDYEYLNIDLRAREDDFIRDSSKFAEQKQDTRWIRIVHT